MCPLIVHADEQIMSVIQSRSIMESLERCVFRLCCNHYQMSGWRRGTEERDCVSERGKKRNKDEDKWQSKKILKVMENNVVYAYNICFNFILCTHTLL